jgi:hypothetical protein
VVVVGEIVDTTVVEMDTAVFFLGAVDEDVVFGVFVDCFSQEDLGEGGWSLEGLIAVVEEVVACQGGSRWFERMAILRIFLQVLILLWGWRSMVFRS